MCSTASSRTQGCRSHLLLCDCAYAAGSKRQVDAVHMHMQSKPPTVRFLRAPQQKMLGASGMFELVNSATQHLCGSQPVLVLLCQHVPCSPLICPHPSSVSSSSKLALSRRGRSATPPQMSGCLTLRLPPTQTSKGRNAVNLLGCVALRLPPTQAQWREPPAQFAACNTAKTPPRPLIQMGLGLVGPPHTVV